MTRAQPGLVRAMTLVVVTRLHNAAAAAGGMRRGLAYARAYADAPPGRRRPARRLARCTGPPWAPSRVDAAGAFVLAGHAFALLGRVEVGGDPAAAAELRLVAPLAKLATGRLAVASASEYVECFGGAGYVEDTGVPRLLRDAQVLPIWEGTTNVLALDVLRARGPRRRRPRRVLARLAAAADLARAAVSPALADTLADAAPRSSGAAIAAVAADPAASAVLAGARGLALRLAYALAAALLVEHAAVGRRGGRMRGAAVGAALAARRGHRGRGATTTSTCSADPRPLLIMRLPGPIRTKRAGNLMINRACTGSAVPAGGDAVVPAGLPVEGGDDQLGQGGAEQQVLQRPPVGRVGDQQDPAAVPVPPQVGQERPGARNDLHVALAARERRVHVAGALRGDLGDGGAVEVAVVALAQPRVLHDRRGSPAKAISTVSTARRRSELNTTSTRPRRRSPSSAACSRPAADSCPGSQPAPASLSVLMACVS